MEPPLTDGRPALGLDGLVVLLRDRGPASAADIASWAIGREAGDDERRLVNTLFYQHPELVERNEDNGKWSLRHVADQRSRREAGSTADLPVPLETFTDLSTVRDDLVRSLQLDLLGPDAPDESLEERPTSRYLLGILEPGGAGLVPDAVERSDVEAEIDADAVPDVAADARRGVSVWLAGSAGVAPVECRVVEHAPSHPTRRGTGDRRPGPDRPYAAQS